MKYTLDTIPVLDAYKSGCECPLCRLRIHSEDQYVDSMLASTYMEPEWRIRSNETGFCARHFELMFDRRNHLGLALMTHTHMQEVIKSLEGILAGGSGGAKKGLLSSLRGGKSDENSTPARSGVRNMPKIFEADAEQMAAGTLPPAIDVKAMDDCTVEGSTHRNRMPV